MYHVTTDLDKRILDLYLGGRPVGQSCYLYLHVQHAPLLCSSADVINANVMHFV